MKQIIAILLCCFFLSAKAQEDTNFHFVRKITGDITAFTVDNLDNIYILNSRNQVKKINANGDSVAVYNNIRKYGQTTLIDVSNPLKVLLYYKDFATVAMLDRFLNVVNTVDLRKQNILQAKAIAQSYDNKIWVYDEMENKLKKVDEDGKLLQETPDFRLLLDVASQPVKIFDENKYVYLYDSTYGIFVFDYYGTLRNNIMITGWKNFKVTGKYIYGSKADTLYRYDISDFQYDEWKLPGQLNNTLSFNFTAGRVYALKPEADKGLSSILVYAIR
ncbi:MAG: hypothetical protein IPH18_10420 [Chitinophagaceae bacterium]|nr:hypothetical protein [Chitinophagaceae bacterium]MBK8952039.1 hypothetical protein [Chitinophagaceae bacterium]